ncbi:MAG: hypothetical protein WD052_03460 [Bacteroidales bacterium]
MRKALLTIGLLCFISLVYSQKSGYDISFHQIFDNREYFSDYGFPQTIFGARLDASMLFMVDSVHSFAAGFNYLYEHGSSIMALVPQVNLYYRFNKPRLKMVFGSFPRRNRLDFSPAFLNDTLNYYRSNVEGAFISYSKGLGEVSGFIDWTGRVSEDTRETFLAGLRASLTIKGFFVEPAFLMYHNARSRNPNDTIPLQDNGIFSLLAGYRITNIEVPYELSISTGYISSYNRFRPAGFTRGEGMISNIDLRYTIFGLKGVYYIGTPIDFSYGDPFYRSGNYGRLDLFTDPFRNASVESKIGWSFHFVPGEGIHHSQQILISVTF